MKCYSVGSGTEAIVDKEMAQARRVGGATDLLSREMETATEDLSSAKPEHPGLKARTVVSCHRSQSSSYGPQGRRDRSQSWSYGPSLVFIAESRHRTDHRVVRTAVSRSHSMNRRGSHSRG